MIIDYIIYQKRNIYMKKSSVTMYGNLKPNANGANKEPSSSPDSPSASGKSSNTAAASESVLSPKSSVLDVNISIKQQQNIGDESRSSPLRNLTNGVTNGYSASSAFIAPNNTFELYNHQQQNGFEQLNSSSANAIAGSLNPMSGYNSASGYSKLYVPTPTVNSLQLPLHQSTNGSSSTAPSSISSLSSVGSPLIHPQVNKIYLSAQNENLKVFNRIPFS